MRALADRLPVSVSICRTHREPLRALLNYRIKKAIPTSRFDLYKLFTATICIRIRLLYIAITDPH